MIRFLHSADLHLSQKEKDYSLSVLKEIVSIASEELCTHILFCGDLFDRNSDIAALKEEVRSILQSFPGRIFYIPGNHEELGLPEGTYPISADLSPMLYPQKGENVKLWLEEIDGVSAEFFGFPFNRNLDYSNIQFKEKKVQYRIALLHGTETKLVEYLGPSPEEADSILDSGPFLEAKFDYLALGHIHSKRHEVSGSLLKAYPGSPRIVSLGESGVRTVNIVSLGKNGTPVLKERIVSSAGEFKDFSISVTLSGEIPELEKTASLFSKTDTVRIRVSGIVEDEHVVSETLNRFTESARCRKIEIKTSDLKTSSALIDNPVAKLFYEKLMDLQRSWSGADAPDWNEILVLGLEQIEENAGKNER
ncbi:metallophosphoesterase family protein [Leptospira adleri]|uniref:metallophosphoesterase family protein n=1 Tax=Leptospira adleri TaxID=2023186 RepID=UPI001082E1F6|nr:metallophosphoesterase [Leptospira adleri]TGM53256.1 DNA repair exonuclease [Leptospira adleri]